MCVFGQHMLILHEMGYFLLDRMAAQFLGRDN